MATLTADDVPRLIEAVADPATRLAIELYDRGHRGHDAASIRALQGLLSDLLVQINGLAAEVVQLRDGRTT